MARNQFRFGRIIIAASVFLGILIISGIVFYPLIKKPNNIIKLPDFPVARYVESGNLWSHEDYKIKGRINNILLRSDNGQKWLLSIKPDDSDTILPVIILQREQKILLRVSLDGDGYIICQEYQNESI